METGGQRGNGYDTESPGSVRAGSAKGTWRAQRSVKPPRKLWGFDSLPAHQNLRFGSKIRSFRRFSLPDAERLSQPDSSLSVPPSLDHFRGCPGPLTYKPPG